MEYPLVMGILNATPDSFYAGSRMQTEKEIARRTNQIVEEGGTIIDVGACSTRPDSDAVSEEEELSRARKALAVVRQQQPDAIVSIDTFRPAVARMAVEEFGVGIINDVQSTAVTHPSTYPPPGGRGACFDLPMFKEAGRLQVPYVLTSLEPAVNPMLLRWAHEVEQLREAGVKDIILDPGFGFGKTLEENYTLMNELEKLKVMNLPLLVGVSRKSMIYKLLGITPDEALGGSTVLHTIALMKGASILRVHDVKDCIQALKIVSHVSKI